ncbi:MAG: hypothetical protein AB7O24_05470 [Kofleriaceae bacterium]
MFVAIERLLIKARQPRSRAAELITLHDRLRHELAREIDDEQRELSDDVRARKLAVAAELRAVVSCSSCAAGAPWPRGGYSGGDCCSGVTATVFDDTELAALAHAGTRTHDLIPPAGTDAHAGCAFRGERGCSLDVSHRPARCIHYVCDKLRSELHERGQLDRVEQQLAELNDAVQRFAAARQDQLDRDVLAPIIASIAAASRRT